MNIETIIGSLAAILITAANLPQAYKTIKTQAVTDLSPMSYTLLSIANVSWLIYGLLREDWPVILSNGISGILTCIILYQILKSRRARKKRKR